MLQEISVSLTTCSSQTTTSLASSCVDYNLSEHKDKGCSINFDLMLDSNLSPDYFRQYYS